MCTCLIEQTVIFHTSYFQDSFKKKRQTLSRDTDTAINRLFTTPLLGALWPLCSQWWAYLQALCSWDLLHTSLCFERWSSQASGSFISIQIIFQACEGDSFILNSLITPLHSICSCVFPSPQMRDTICRHTNNKRATKEMEKPDLKGMSVSQTGL